MEYDHKFVKGLSIVLHKTEENLSDPLLKLVWRGIRPQLPKILKSVDSNHELVEEMRLAILEYVEEETIIEPPKVLVGVPEELPEIEVSGSLPFEKILVGDPEDIKPKEPLDEPLEELAEQLEELPELLAEGGGDLVAEEIEEEEEMDKEDNENRLEG